MIDARAGRDSGRGGLYRASRHLRYGLDVGEGVFSSRISSSAKRCSPVIQAAAAPPALANSCGHLRVDPRPSVPAGWARNIRPNCGLAQPIFCRRWSDWLAAASLAQNAWPLAGFGFTKPAARCHPAQTDAPFAPVSRRFPFCLWLGLALTAGEGAFLFAVKLDACEDARFERLNERVVPPTAPW